MEKQAGVALRPIGVVRNGLDAKPRTGWEEVVSEIHLNPLLAAGLEGLDEFSHIYVLFWMDRVGEAERGVLRVHPVGREDLPEVGVFATHSKWRPNPIGLSVVELVRVEGSRLKVKGLDALDGTPVLDMKSYSPQLDAGGPCRVPAWVEELRRTTGA